MSELPTIVNPNFEEITDLIEECKRNRYNMYVLYCPGGAGHRLCDILFRMVEHCDLINQYHKYRYENLVSEIKYMFYNCMTIGALTDFIIKKVSFQVNNIGPEAHRCSYPTINGGLAHSMISLSQSMILYNYLWDFIIPQIGKTLSNDTAKELLELQLLDHMSYSVSMISSVSSQHCVGYSAVLANNSREYEDTHRREFQDAMNERLQIAYRKYSDYCSCWIRRFHLADGSPTNDICCWCKLPLRPEEEKMESESESESEEYCEECSEGSCDFS